MIYALVDKNKNLLDDFTSKLGLRIDEYISDCCINDELTKKLSNKDVLIIENVLALGGYVEEIVNTISRLSSLDIDLYLIKEDLHIKASELSDIASSLSIAHKIHCSLLSLRSQKAIHNRISKGQRVGRPVNSFSSKKLDGKVDELKALLSKGMPLTDIAVELNVSRSTIYNYMKNNQKLLRGEINA